MSVSRLTIYVAIILIYCIKITVSWSISWTQAQCDKSYFCNKTNCTSWASEAGCNNRGLRLLLRFLSLLQWTFLSLPLTSLSLMFCYPAVAQTFHVVTQSIYMGLPKDAVQQSWNGCLISWKSLWAAFTSLVSNLLCFSLTTETHLYMRITWLSVDEIIWAIEMIFSSLKLRIQNHVQWPWINSKQRYEVTVVSIFLLPETIRTKPTTRTNLACFTSDKANITSVHREHVTHGI